MPLVPLSLIREWYKTTSPVYRQFAFAFKNRLWDKPIPKGMAVCAFWWLSVFSVLVLRPFVGLILIIRATARALHLSDLLRWTDRHSKRILGGDSGSFGVPTFLMGVLTLMVVIVLGGLSLMVVESIQANTLSLLILGGVCLGGAMMAALIQDSDVDVLINRPSKMQVRVAYWILSTLIVATAAFARPDLFMGVMDDVWMLLSYLWDSLWSWVTSLFVWSGHLIADFAYVTWAYRWFYAGCAAICALSGAIAWRTDTSRLYLKESYLDVRLRKVRRAIKQVIQDHVVHHLRMHQVSGKDAIAYAQSSWTISEAVRQIVDSDAWLKVDLSRLGLSITGERMTMIAEQVLIDWRAEQEAIKQQKAWARRMVALEMWVHGTRAYRLLHEAGKQVVTFGCVVWELIKAAKTRSCPWMLFSTEGQPIDPQPAVQPVQMAAQPLAPGHQINQGFTDIHVTITQV